MIRGQDIGGAFTPPGDRVFSDLLLVYKASMCCGTICSRQCSLSLCQARDRASEAQRQRIGTQPWWASAEKSTRWTC